VNIRKAVVGGTCLIALFGCKQQTAQKEKAKDSSPVVAEVNGTAITADQFRQELKNLPPQLQVIAESPDGKKQLLDQLVVRQIVLQEAKKAGLDKSKEVADRLEEMKDKVLVETYLKKRLEEQAKISDEELKKVYEQYKEQFKRPEQIHASHILVKTEKEAQDVQAQLKKGASFEDLAKKYSTDSAAAKGGDLGWFGKGAMLPEFEKAAFALHEGETSGIVKTKFGYHIVKLTGKRPAGVLPFDEVKDQIKTALLPQKQQELFQKLKEDLKKNAKITIKEDALKGMDIKPGEAAKPGQPAK
jgi:peptidyl-prolyl cis-trans isomerase C